jgi:hypothetical protein
MAVYTLFFLDRTRSQIAVCDGPSARNFPYSALLQQATSSYQFSSSTFEPAQIQASPAMSRDDEAKPVTVKIIETVFVEADTADDFKSVVQRLTGKDDAVAQPEQTSRSPSRAAQRIGAGKGGGGDRQGGTSGTKQNG